MSTPTLLGLPTTGYARPLVDAFARAHNIRAHLDVPARLAVGLRERTLRGALLTPIDYARDSSAYLVVPGAIVASHGPTGPVTLQFRHGLRSVSTIAVDPSSANEIILARIVLAEEFGSFPSVVPVQGPAAAMLARADAALLVGGGYEAVPGGQLDLIEAWAEMTGLPFCYGLWCRSRGSMTQPEIEAVRAAHQEAQERAGESDTPFQYVPTRETGEGLRAFLHYAYYHGVLPDVPDVNTRDAVDEQDDDESAPGPSVN
ncbi:MAG: mqnA [Bacteroidetes bacterium]|nr:mqnA [Bacteroidota bacterium]